MSYYYPYPPYYYPQPNYYYDYPPHFQHYSVPYHPFPTEMTPIQPVEPSIPTEHPAIENFVQLPEEEEVNTDETQNERLWYSIERRENKRIYICNECSKEFTRAFNLKDHFKAIHLQIRPYRCPFHSCDSSFVRKNDCIRHMKLIHKKVKSLK